MKSVLQKRTIFDLPLALFLVTAGIGVWAAYQRELAWGKFWVIVAAVLVYYAVSSLSVRNSWVLSGLLGLIAIGIGCYFLLTHDWQTLPADLSFLNMAAQKWVSVRPMLDLPATNQNQAGGLLAMCLPFPIALGWQAWREKKQILALLAFGTSLLILVLLLSTSSRGAWLASIVGFGIWFLWEARESIFRSFARPRSTVTMLLLLAGFGSLVLVFVLVFREGVVDLFARIFGRATAASRMSLYADTLHLIDDFPILGGGLGSFPGLYSQYIKLLPFFYFGYSHNFYLDVTLEQGLVGILSLTIIFFGSLWLVARHIWSVHRFDSSYLLSWAVLVGLVTVLLHGLMDDPLYGEKGTPLLFLLSGLSIASTRSSRIKETSEIDADPERGLRGSHAFKWSTLLLGLFLSVVLLVLLSGFAKPVLAELYANIGAVKMAQAELSSWPTRKWSEDSDISTLLTAKQWFERSLQLDPENETSHYRLGLIALRAQDFHNSGSHLASAQAVDLDHRGLRKSLGYSYLWSGQLLPGAQLLKEIPEAEHELLVYVNWWKKLGNADLSERARSATLLLRLFHMIDQETSKEIAEFE